MTANGPPELENENIDNESKDEAVEYETDAYDKVADDYGEAKVERGRRG